MRSDYINIDKNLLIKIYEDNKKSLLKTANVLNISEKTIKRRFIEYGLEYDKKIKYTCNESFFDDLNERTLYWLGFLATDGNVYKHKYSYTTSLKLATKDISILESFKQDLKYTGPIHSYTTINNGKNINFKKPKYYYSEIMINSKKIFDRLAIFNIVPNKTHIYTIPEQLKLHPLVNHYIRGCIDGDGWIRYHKNNNSAIINEVRIGMCGNELLTKDVFNLIRTNLNINSGTIYKRKNTNYWYFEFTSLHDVNKIVNWIYTDSTIRLERKYNISKKVQELLQQQ